MKRSNRPSLPIPEPDTIVLPPKDYQPSKANMDEEIDMPGMLDKQMRESFFPPRQFCAKKQVAVAITHRAPAGHRGTIVTLGYNPYDLRPIVVNAFLEAESDVYEWWL